MIIIGSRARAVVFAIAATCAISLQPALAETLRMVLQAHPSVGNKCWDVPFRRYNPGAAVHQWECNNSPAQIFDYDEATRLLKAGGLCVTAVAGGGSGISLAACNGQPNQLWTISASGEYYQITATTGQCVEAKGGGDALELQKCEAARMQRLWALVEAPAQSAAGTSTQTAAASGTQVADLAGDWKSQWGVVTIRVGSDGNISGSWAQEPGKTGELRRGVFDAAEGAVMFTTAQPWNGAVGVASFRLSPDRKKLIGSWSITRPDGKTDGGPWVLTK